MSQNYTFLTEEGLNSIRSDLVNDVKTFRDQCVSLAKQSGIDRYEPRFADANTNRSNYEPGEIVAVQADETRGMRFSVYIVNDELKLVLLYFPLDLQRSDVVELRHYLNDAQANAVVETTSHREAIPNRETTAYYETFTLISGEDCTEQFEAALHDAQRTGKLLDLSGLSIYLSDRSIEPLAAHGGLVSTGGPAKVYVDNWQAKRTYESQTVKLHTLFRWTSERGNDWACAGVNFYNLEQDGDQGSKVFGNGGECRDALFRDTWAYGFSSFASVGWYERRGKADEDGVTNDDYYADPGARYVFGSNVGVVCDRTSTGGHAKLFDVHGTVGFALYGPTVESARANGYGIRITGSENSNNQPRQGESGSNNRISDYNCTVKADNYWFNQLAKVASVTITGGTYRSTGFKAHNAWDIFACFGVTLSASTFWHCGAAFFGHANHNRSGDGPGPLGARGFNAHGNVVINCEHEHVFNVGGDGNVGGPRQGAMSSITSNVVFDMPGFQGQFKQAHIDNGLTAEDYDNLKRTFVYGFIHSNCDIKANNVHGIERWLRTYFCRGFVIAENTWRPFSGKVAEEWFADGADSSTRPRVAANNFLYDGDVTRTFAGQNAIITLDYYYRRKQDSLSDATHRIGYASQATAKLSLDSAGFSGKPRLVKVYLFWELFTGNSGVVEYLCYFSGEQFGVQVVGSSNDSFDNRFNVRFNENDRNIEIVDTRDQSIGWQVWLTRVAS